MAFSSNTSAFGLKPATTSTNPLFGGSAPAQQQQQQPTNSLFGSTTGQPSGSIFGNTAGQTQSQPTTSLFGSAAPNNNQTSIFGQQPQQQQQQAGSNPLFGSKPFGQSTQQNSSNLFGQSASPFGQTQNGQQPQQQQQQQQQTNAFGGSSIFGSNNAGGGFGASPTNNNANQGTGMFGQSQANNNNNMSMFGQKPAQTPTLGLAASQQGNVTPLFTRSTKFNDLPDEMKKMFENLESHIQGRVQISKDLHQRKLGEEASAGYELIRSMHKDLSNTSTTINSDLHFAKDLKGKVDQAVQDTIVAIRIVDGFKNPQANGSYLKDYASFPLEFFMRVTNEMHQKLTWYKSTTEQIERKLSSMANQAQYTPQGIVATLQAQHTTFLALASKTASLDAELQKIRAAYAQQWRARTGSARDPFNELDMNRGSEADLGMSGLGM